MYLWVFKPPSINQSELENSKLILKPSLFPVKVPASTLNSLAAAARADEPEGLGTKVPASGSSHAARGTRRLIYRWGLLWKVPMSYYKMKHDDKVVDIPFLSPIKFMKFLLQKHPEYLFGGADHILGQKLLRSFWETYRPTHETHETFRHHSACLGNVIPLLLHGDEGRGVRKGNTCLVTLESILGLDTAENIETLQHFANCRACAGTGIDLSKPAKTQGVSQHVDLARYQALNLTHHVFLSRFPMFLLPNDLYKDTDLLPNLLQIICSELRQLFWEGVEAYGQYWHFSLLGLKGDLAWIAKIGELQRCFHKLSYRQDTQMCHECGAGSSTMPFEDLSERPSWESSIFESRPWGTNEPGFLQVPFDIRTPERILRRDIFHNSKVGTYRDYAASAILLLCHLQIFHEPPGPGVSNNIKSLLRKAHGHFRLFLAAVGKKAALHSFNKENMNAKTKKKFPWSNTKGSDTMLLVEWLSVAIGGFRLAHPQHEEVLKMLQETAEAAFLWMNGMYKHGMWVPRLCAQTLYKHGRKFLLTYSSLAHMALHHLRFFGFAMKPKIHMLSHTLVEWRQLFQNPGVSWLPNPLWYTCEPNEDAIGRLSRVARRSHQARVCENTLPCYLTKAKALHKRFQARRGKKRKAEG